MHDSQERVLKSVLEISFLGNHKFLKVFYIMIEAKVILEDFVTTFPEKSSFCEGGS